MCLNMLEKIAEENCQSMANVQGGGEMERCRRKYYIEDIFLKRFLKGRI